MATTVLYLSEVKRACSLPAEMWRGNLSKRIFPDHIRVNSLGPMGNKMPQHNKLKSILWKRIYERCTMWHFILHSQISTMLTVIWESSDVCGSLEMLGRSFWWGTKAVSAAGVLVVPSGFLTSLISKTALVKNLHLSSSAGKQNLCHSSSPGKQHGYNG